MTTAIGELPEEGETPQEEQTPEGGLETKNEEVEQLRSELQKMEQNLKSAQGVTRKQSQDIEELRGKLDTAVSSRDTYQALIGLLSQQTGRSEEDIETEVQTRKPDLVKQTQSIIVQQEQRTQQRRYQERVNSYQEKVEKELGLKEGDDDYDAIQGFVLAGKFDKADKRIEKVRSKVSETKEETKEPEEDKIQKLVEKRLRQEMEKAGLLKTESGSPSASGGKTWTREEIKNMPLDEYAKIKPEIDKARREGKIRS